MSYSPFLHRLSDIILNSYGRNMENLTMVFPSRRAGLFFRKALSDRANSAFLLPEIDTIEDFIFKISQREKAENVDLLFTLYDSYLNVFGDKSKGIDDFIGIGRIILKDFSEIDDYLVHPQKLLNVLAEYYRIEQFDLELSGHLQKEYQSFFDRLPLLYDHFVAELEKEKIANKAVAARMIAENPTLIDQYIGNRHFVFAGFNALTPAESSIVQHLYSNKRAEIFWDCDQYYLQDQKHEAGYFLREHRLRWPETFRDIPSNIGKQQHFELIGAPKQLTQVQLTLDLLHDFVKDNKGAETAVVLCDESLMPMFFQSMEAELRAQVNFSMGFPAGLTQVGQFFKQWLDMKINPIFEMNKMDQTPRDQLVNLLLNPLTIDLLSHDVSSDLLSQWANDISLGPRLIPSAVWNQAEVESTSSFACAIKDVNDHFGHFFRYGGGVLELIEQGMDFCKKMIDGQQTYDNDIEYLKTESAFLLLQVLGRTKYFVETHRLELEMAPHTFKSLVLGELNSAKIPLKGVPLHGIQIIGMLESRCLDFENIVFVGANEGFFPDGVSMQTLIPFDLRRFTDAHLPTWIESESIASYYYYRLLHHAKNITMVYNTLPDEFAGKEPSRFIHQLQYELKPRYSENISITQRFINFEIEKNPATLFNTLMIDREIVSERLEFFKNSGFSFSNFFTFLECPYKFYLSSILRIREKESKSSDIQARESGLLLHLFFETEFSPFLQENIQKHHLDQMLAKTHPDVFSDYLGSLISDRRQKILKDPQAKHEETLWNHLSQLDFSVGMNFLVIEMLRKGIARNINFLSDRISEKSQFKIHSIEQKFSSDLLLKGEGMQEKIRLMAIVDRVEKWNTDFRIVDFKTKKSDKEVLPLMTEPKKKKVAAIDFQESNNIFKINKSRELQQLLYYLYVLNSAGLEYEGQAFSIENAANYFILSAGSKHNPIIQLENGDEFFYSQWAEAVNAGLVEIFSEIYSKDQSFEPLPEKKKCDWCIYKNILCHA